MRKIITLVLVCLLAVAMVSTTASAAKKKKKKPAFVQTQTGSIAIPTPLRDSGQVPGCFSGGHRRGATTTQSHNGVIGYSFDVDPRTYGKRFVLTADSSQGAGADLDITFYTEYGADPSANAGALTAYETVAPGGEKGIVPKGFSKVIVCNNSGANATFTYKAGDGIK